MLAPDGAPASSENVRVCAGTSGSVAVAVKVNATSSFTVLLPMAARTGAWLAGTTKDVGELVMLPPVHGTVFTLLVPLVGVLPLQFRTVQVPETETELAGRMS